MNTEQNQPMHMQTNPQSAPMYIQQTPPPAYAPPPFYPPPYGFRFEIRTVKGLKFINWGLWVNACALLVALMFAVAIMLGGFNAFAAALGLSLGSSVFGVIFFILWIIGLFFMHTGKHEFGPAHASRVHMAIVFLVIAIAIAIAGAFVSIFFIFSTTDFGDDFDTTWRMIFALQLMFGFFSNLFLSLMWVYLIIELSEIRIRNFLWLYFGLSLALYAVSAIFLVAWGFWLSNIQTLVGSIGIIASVVLIYCYWETYNRVLRGEIKPVPVPMMPPPYFPPGQPPYYPPQAPPSYPPQYLKDPYRR